MNESEDGWLSTRNKRKISTPSSCSKRRRQSLVSQRPLWSATASTTRIITQHSPPPPAVFKHTRQTDIKSFFKNGTELRPKWDEAVPAPEEVKETRLGGLGPDEDHPHHVTGDEPQSSISRCPPKWLPLEYCCDKDNTLRNAKTEESMPKDFGNFTLNVDLSDVTCSEVSNLGDVSPKKISGSCTSSQAEGKDSSFSVCDTETSGNNTMLLELNSEVDTETVTPRVDKLSDEKSDEDKENCVVGESSTNEMFTKHNPKCIYVEAPNKRKEGTMPAALLDNTNSSAAISSENTGNFLDSLSSTQMSAELLCDLEQTLDSEDCLSEYPQESEAPFTFAFLSQDPTLRTRGVIPGTPVDKGDNSCNAVKLEDTAENILYTQEEEDIKSSLDEVDFASDSQTLDSDNGCCDFSDSQFV